jgi:pyridoxamine 5'-phosphate oxidase-like protein
MQWAMQWSDLIAQQPSLGDIAHEKLIKPGVLLIGTIRRDGSPRISGVEPLIMDGHLWLSMLKDSSKARDLARNPRIVLNSIVTGPEPGSEIKAPGSVHPEPDHSIQERYAHTVATKIGWQPIVGHFTLFTVHIDNVTYIGYDLDTQGQHVAQWPPAVEYIRPATTSTSLGPRQHVRRILD